MTAKHAEAEQKIVKITGELNTSEANVKKLEQEIGGHKENLKITKQQYENQIGEKDKEIARLKN